METASLTRRRGRRPRPVETVRANLIIDRGQRDRVVALADKYGETVSATVRKLLDAALSGVER